MLILATTGAVVVSTILALRAQKQAYARAALLLNVFFFIILSLPQNLGAGGPESPIGRRNTVKKNMHALQLGVEQYAGDNYGNYPDGVLDSGFDWAKYVPSNPTNPYDKSIKAVASMESDVKTAGSNGGPVYLIAQTYTGKGRQGSMRYFSDTGNKSTYAIIGYEEDGKLIKETSNSTSKNFVLHN